jgi:hypothetical protein
MKEEKNKGRETLRLLQGKLKNIFGSEGS